MIIDRSGSCLCWPQLHHITIPASQSRYNCNSLRRLSASCFGVTNVWWFAILSCANGGAFSTGAWPHQTKIWRSAASTVSLSSVSALPLEPFTYIYPLSATTPKTTTRTSSKHFRKSPHTKHQQNYKKTFSYHIPPLPFFPSCLLLKGTGLGLQVSHPAKSMSLHIVTPPALGDRNFRIITWVRLHPPQKVMRSPLPIISWFMNHDWSKAHASGPLSPEKARKTKGRFVLFTTVDSYLDVEKEVSSFGLVRSLD